MAELLDHDRSTTTPRSHTGKERPVTGRAETRIRQSQGWHRLYPRRLPRAPLPHVLRDTNDSIPQGSPPVRRRACGPR